MCEYFIEMVDRLKNHPFADSIKSFILSFEDEELKKYLSFLYLHMPYADIANVDKEVILDYAKSGVNLRNTRCKDLDEDIFLNYVLFHRIGSEKIVANRTFFYDLIKDMLGESETENILKLNYFCGKNVTYRTTDIRTLDPITVYKSSFGRCGEESIFAERQVYLQDRSMYRFGLIVMTIMHGWRCMWIMTGIILEHVNLKKYLIKAGLMMLQPEQ